MIGTVEEDSSPATAETCSKYSRASARRPSKAALARAVQRGERRRSRIARVLREAVQRLERHGRARDVVELEQDVDVPAARGERHHRLARPLGQREQLAAATPGPDRLPSGPQVASCAELRAIASVASSPSRRAIASASPASSARRATSSDQYSATASDAEQPHAHRVVGRADPFERVDEQRDVCLVDIARRERERREAQRRAAEDVVGVDRPRGRNGGLERRARRRSAGARLCGAQTQQQRGPARDVDVQPREHLERAREQLGGVLVGQRLEGAGRRPARRSRPPCRRRPAERRAGSGGRAWAGGPRSRPGRPSPAPRRRRDDRLMRTATGMPARSVSRISPWPKSYVPDRVGLRDHDPERGGLVEGRQHAVAIQRRRVHERREVERTADRSRPARGSPGAARRAAPGGGGSSRARSRAAAARRVDARDGLRRAAAPAPRARRTGCPRSRRGPRRRRRRGPACRSSAR